MGGKMEEVMIAHGPSSFVIVYKDLDVVRKIFTFYDKICSTSMLNKSNQTQQLCLFGYVPRINEDRTIQVIWNMGTENLKKNARQ